MTSIVITVGMSIGLFFAGFLGGYVIAEQTYSPQNLMINDPQTTTQWMSTILDTMMNDPGLRQQMINQMMQNPDMMNTMMNNQQMMNMMGMNNTITNQGIMNP